MTLINTILKHFLYNVGINILFDKLIENFPQTKYDFIDIDFDDIQVGDTILSVNKYDDPIISIYAGTVREVNVNNRSISYKNPMRCDVLNSKWVDVQVVPVFSDTYYSFTKRIKRH